MADSSVLPTLIESAMPTSTQSEASTSTTASISYPPCAQSCLAEVTSALPCDHSDSQCLCLQAANVQFSVTACLAASGACSATDETSAALYYITICQALGYPTTPSSTSTSQLLTDAIVSATGSPTPISATSTASIATTPTTSQKPTQATAPASTSSAAPASQSNQLPLAAVAGIAAGTALVVAILIAIAVYLYVRHQSQDGEDRLHSDQRNKNGGDGSQYDSSRAGDNGALKRHSSVLALEKILPTARRTSNGLFALHKETASTTVPGKTPLTLTNATDTWYNKRQAELSTTSLTSKTHNAHNPIPKSPSVTEFSDAASICSATASNTSWDGNRPSSPAHTSAVPASLGPQSQPQTQTPHHRSMVVGSQYIFNPPPTSFSQPRPPTSHSEKSRPTTANADAAHAQPFWGTPAPVETGNTQHSSMRH